MIELDGSFGEGGGQILRTSLALSLLTGKPFHLANVRANREKPGLQPQHLMCVRAASRIGNAQVRGDSKGSMDLVFEPGEVVPGKYTFDIGTAGATALLLHSIYLPLCLGVDAPSELTLIGGTHVRAAPCFHFLDITWRRYLAKMGCSIRVEMKRPGFYPRGGGEVHVHIQPVSMLHGITPGARGEVHVTGFSAVAGLPDHIARRQARRARFLLEQRGLDVSIEEQTWEGGPGSVLGLELSTSPASTFFFGLGARGKPAETVAEDAVEQVIDYLNAPSSLVDCHSADQIVLPLALAPEASEYSVTKVTQHLLTNVEVIRQFIDRDILCEGEEGQPGHVRISASG